MDPGWATGVRPCGRILQDKIAREGLSPSQIWDQVFLNFEVKKNFPTTRMQKGSLEVKREGASTVG